MVPTCWTFPSEVLQCVYQHLGVRDRVRVAASARFFRYGRSELPSESVVATVLREHAFTGGGLIPPKRTIGCSELWVAYLARRARQRRCRGGPPFAAGWSQSVFYGRERPAAVVLRGWLSGPRRCVRH